MRFMVSARDITRVAFLTYGEKQHGHKFSDINVCGEGPISQGSLGQLVITVGTKADDIRGAELLRDALDKAIAYARSGQEVEA